MPEPLGKLISLHGTSPAYLQRAAIIAVLSFLFFLAMLIAFYIRQQIGYFILSSAFLVVYMFTMIGWWLQKRNVVRIYENGIAYRKFIAVWDQIQSISGTKDGGIKLSKIGGSETVLPGSLHDVGKIASYIKSRTKI